MPFLDFEKEWGALREKLALKLSGWSHIWPLARQWHMWQQMEKWSFHTLWAMLCNFDTSLEKQICQSPSQAGVLAQKRFSSVWVPTPKDNLYRVFARQFLSYISNTMNPYTAENDRLLLSSLHISWLSAHWRATHTQYFLLKEGWGEVF